VLLPRHGGAPLGCSLTVLLPVCCLQVHSYLSLSENSLTGSIPDSVFTLSALLYASEAHAI
jgi:hypothetical protein